MNVRETPRSGLPEPKQGLLSLKFARKRGEKLTHSYRIAKAYKLVGLYLYWGVVRTNIPLAAGGGVAYLGEKILKARKQILPPPSLCHTTFCGITNLEDGSAGLRELAEVFS